MKTFLAIAASGITASGLYAGGVFDRGEVYDLPIAEVRSRLASVQIPQMAAMTATGTDGAAIRVTSDGQTVRWDPNGRADPAFAAFLTAEGPTRTRVILDYLPASLDQGFGDRLRSTRFLRGYAETSFAEEVDARLEGRIADQAQAARDFGRHVASDPEAVRELGLVTEDMFKSVSNQMNATMHANRVEPTARQTMAAATEPAIKLQAN